MAKSNSKALNSPDAELEAAAQVSMEDVTAARDAARRHSRGGQLHALLEAEATA